ncbi:MAG: 16S rRNA processing protein RimM [Alphaproteobacteria bacterium]|nr:16S rRNA processing protein RimM [Alphaproteobacteria bacterium]
MTIGRDAENNRTGSARQRKICVGQFAGAHGVRGLAKLRSFTEDPEAIFDYKPLSFEDGRTVKVGFKSAVKDCFLVSVDGVDTKEQADLLRGDKLYVPRAALPKTRKGEYYEADLVGLTVTDAAGHSYGRIMALHDHGAGAFIEIGTHKKDSFMLPFKDAFVPDIDVVNGTARVVIPDGWLSKDKE